MRARGPEGRYHRCHELLGGYPEWQKEEVELIGQYVSNLSQKARRARVAGSELDAALSAPRWRAVAA